MGGARNVAAGLHDDTTHIVTVEADTDVRIADRLTIADATFEVLAVATWGAWELARRAQVKEVPDA